jgi:hypothetical protein
VSDDDQGEREREGTHRLRLHADLPRCVLVKESDHDRAGTCGWRDIVLRPM